LTSLLESSASYSPSTAVRLPADIPTTLHSLVDQKAIDAMSQAVEAAPPVWAMMDSILADLPEEQGDTQETLAKAQNVTRQLKTDISLLQDGMNVDRKSLRNDAHLFVKVSFSRCIHMLVFPGSSTSACFSWWSTSRLT
jgi:hypothetical protein